MYLKPNVSDFFPALPNVDLLCMQCFFAGHLARIYQLIDQRMHNGELVQVVPMSVKTTCYIWPMEEQGPGTAGRRLTWII